MKYLILTLLSFLFLSCSGNKVTELNITQLGKLEMGNQLDSLISIDKKYGLDYELISEVTIPEVNDSKYQIVISKYFLLELSESFYNYTAMAFENKKLIYFGLPEDFFKSRDRKVNYLGEKIYQEIMELEKKKEESSEND